MRFTVKAGSGVDLTAKGKRRLAQQLATLLATPQGSVPLDRAFGLDWSLVDTPQTRLLPLFVAEVAAKVERYIPQLRLLSAWLEQSGDAAQGHMVPVAQVEIKEEYRDEYR
jgi:phage baseplate assembly protein W